VIDQYNSFYRVENDFVDCFKPFNLFAESLRRAIIVVAVSSSFESVSKRVFTDGSEFVYLEQSHIPGLTDQELDEIWRFVFQDKLKALFQKEKVFSYTGSLPREIIKFAQIYNSSKPIEFGPLTLKYLRDSTKYYYKRLEVFKMETRTEAMEQLDSTAIARVVTSKIGEISAPESWIEMGIVQMIGDRDWSLVCPSVAIAILQKFSENFLPFVNILVSIVFFTFSSGTWV
jgi:hypothetical protein